MRDWCCIHAEIMLRMAIDAMHALGCRESKDTESTKRKAIEVYLQPTWQAGKAHRQQQLPPSQKLEVSERQLDN